MTGAEGGDSLDRKGPHLRLDLHLDLDLDLEANVMSDTGLDE
ncbi:hypothetical protein [Streptomyces sp. G-G2]|nr:hypothetical protein [Streptomyces sp. G-G2]MDJ0386474.1 hypothetical protein [Streptomyces sp. G-G2]